MILRPQKEKIYMSYVINFNNGMGPQPPEFETLAEAKAAALDMAGFTQTSIEILGHNDEIVTVSEWFGVAPTEEEIESGTVLVRFGTEGYYQLWNDELENL